MWRALLLGLVSISALVAAVLNGHVILVTWAFSGIGIIDRESFYLPTLATLGFSAVAIAAGRAAFGQSPLVGRSIVMAAVLTIAVGLFGAAISLRTLTEPLYREHRDITLDVYWSEHPQIPDRAVYEFVGYGPYGMTLREQDGLLEHLREGGENPVKLTVDVMYDGARPTRLYHKEIAGWDLRRQVSNAQHLPDYLGGGSQEWPLPKHLQHHLSTTSP